MKFEKIKFEKINKKLSNKVYFKTNYMLQNIKKKFKI